MATFTLTDQEAHDVIKMLGVAFHSINMGTSPPSIKFRVSELKRIFTLHEHLLSFQDHQDQLAYNKQLHEAMNQPEPPTPEN